MSQGARVAVTLSGGGHRASLFGLGALLFLADAGLRKHIGVVSSVSGGSFVNGFFAALPKSIDQLEDEEFEQAAAVLAGRLRGNPLVWKWVSVPGLLLLPPLVIPLSIWGIPSSWPAGATVVLTGAMIVGWSFLAQRAGGTLFGWWGMYAYLGLALMLLAMAVSGEPFEALPTRVLFGVTCGVLLFYRNMIASIAIDRTIVRDAGAFAEALDTDAEQPHGAIHVICATELHTVDHAYFTPELVYVERKGLAQVDRRILPMAIAASGNLPPALPPRPWRTSRLDWAMTPASLSPMEQSMNTPRDFEVALLTDGGVRDNLGVSFLDEAPRVARLARMMREKMVSEAAIAGRELAVAESAIADVLRRAEARWQPQVDVTVVVDAAPPLGFQAQGGSERYGSRVARSVGAALRFIAPVLTELRYNFGLPNAVYNAGKKAITNDWRRRFATGSAKGAIVQSDHNAEIAAINLMGGRPDLGYPMVEGWRNNVRSAAERVYRVIGEPLEYPTLGQLTRFTDRYATNASPAGHERAARTLYHGYMSTMALCHLWMPDWPLAEAKPTFHPFKRIADGHARTPDLRPVSSESRGPRSVTPEQALVDLIRLINYYTAECRDWGPLFLREDRPSGMFAIYFPYDAHGKAAVRLRHLHELLGGNLNPATLRTNPGLSPNNETAAKLGELLLAETEARNNDVAFIVDTMRLIEHGEHNPIELSRLLHGEAPEDPTDFMYREWNHLTADAYTALAYYALRYVAKALRLPPTDRREREPQFPANVEWLHLMGSQAITAHADLLGRHDQMVHSNLSWPYITRRPAET